VLKYKNTFIIIKNLERGNSMLKNIHQDIMIFPNCSALTTRGRCTRLTLSICQGEGCTFRRSCEEDINSLENAYKRLAALDLPLQLRIAKRYYGGQMPWSEAKNVKIVKFTL